MAGEPGAGDILSAVCGTELPYTFRFRELKRGESVVCTCGPDPIIIIVNLLDSFVLFPRFCVRMYPYYTRH